MHFCQECGARMDRGAKFCSQCGKPWNESIPDNPAKSKDSRIGVASLFVIAVAVAFFLAWLISIPFSYLQIPFLQYIVAILSTVIFGYLGIRISAKSAGKRLDAKKSMILIAGLILASGLIFSTNCLNLKPIINNSSSKISSDSIKTYNDSEDDARTDAENDTGESQEALLVKLKKDIESTIGGGISGDGYEIGFDNQRFKPTITINKNPFKKYKQKALDYLRSRGIDTSDEYNFLIFASRGVDVTEEELYSKNESASTANNSMSSNKLTRGNAAEIISNYYGFPKAIYFVIVVGNFDQMGNYLGLNWDGWNRIWSQLQTMGLVNIEDLGVQRNVFYASKTVNVSLTNKGRTIFTQGNRENEYSAIGCQKILMEVSGISMNSDGVTAIVEYTYVYTPSELSSIAKQMPFFKDNGKDIEFKRLYSKKVQMRKYDDGWRVEKEIITIEDL